MILSQIEQWGLDPANIVGQGYDGAGNMSGRTKGVQACISALHPAAVYIHCKNHSLNLVIVHTCEQRIVSNMFTSLREILYFLTSSPKHLQAYLDVAGPRSKRLQRMSETRWSQHAECVTQCAESYSNVIPALLQLSQESDQNTRSSASSFVKTMESFDFVVTICVCKSLLPHLTPLSDHLQDPHCDLVRASSHAQTLCSLMQKKREDATWSNVWKEATTLADSNNIAVTKPRTTTCQPNCSNTPASTVEEYWCLNLFIPFIDQLIVELQDRLCKPMPCLKAQYLVPSLISSLTDKVWQDLKEEFSQLLPQPSLADTELESWQHGIQTGVVKASNLQEAVYSAHLMFPNIHTILKVLLTMPVSTASAERSFSGLRRLKAYLRSNMTDERLSGLALLHIHHDTKVDIPAVSKDFDATNRRIALLHTPDTA